MATEGQKMKMGTQVINRLEGGLLLILGGMLLLFASGNLYQTLLNPRFSLLSGITGCGLMVLGLVLLRWPLTFELMRAASFAVVIVLFGMVMGFPIDHTLQTISSDEEGGASYPDFQEQFSSREVRAGQEYLRINLGELFDIAEVGTPQQRSRHYLVRGVLLQTSDTQQPVLLRTAISCCLADAVSVGFHIVTSETTLPYRHWVNVYGVLEPYHKPSVAEGAAELSGISFTSIHASYRLRVEFLEQIEPPKVPFMFEFRQQEPYAF